MIIPQNPVLRTRQPVLWVPGNYGEAPVVYGQPTFGTRLGTVDGTAPETSLTLSAASNAHAFTSGDEIQFIAAAPAGQAVAHDTGVTDFVTVDTVDTVTGVVTFAASADVSLWSHPPLGGYLVVARNSVAFNGSFVTTAAVVAFAGGTVDVRIADPASPVAATTLTLAASCTSNAEVVLAMNVDLNAALFTSGLVYAAVGGNSALITLSDPILGAYVAVDGQSAHAATGFQETTFDTRASGQALGVYDYSAGSIGGGEVITLQVGALPAATLTAAPWADAAALAADLNAQANTAFGTTALDYVTVVPAGSDNTLLVSDPTSAPASSGSVTIDATGLTLPGVVAGTYTKAAPPAAATISFMAQGGPGLDGMSLPVIIPMYGVTDVTTAPSKSSASATRIALALDLEALDAHNDAMVYFVTATSNGTDGEVTAPTSIFDFMLTAKVGDHVFSAGLAKATIGVEMVGPLMLGPNGVSSLKTVIAYDVEPGTTKFWFIVGYEANGAALPPAIPPTIKCGIVPQAR